MDGKQRTLSDLLRETHVAPALVDRLARTVFNMGARFPSVFSTTIVANVPATGAETAIVTTPPLTLPQDSAAVFIWWYSNQTVGTGTTARATNIRRGTGTGGALVLNSTAITATAGQIIEVTGCTVDTAVGPGQPQYTMLIAGTGTTAVWSTNSAVIFAAAL